MALQRLGELVVLGLRDLPAVAKGCEVMRLVEHDEVPPRRLEQALDAGRAFERVDACDEPIVLGEGVRLASATRGGFVAGSLPMGREPNPRCHCPWPERSACDWLGYWLQKPVLRHC